MRPRFVPHPRTRAPVEGWPPGRVRAAVVAVVVGAAAAAAVVGPGPADAQERPGRRDPRTLDLGDTTDDGGDDDTDATRRVVNEGGTEVTVYRFGGLDLQGSLRSPQLLYFLSRLRAEFDRPDLPHRSFIPELILSADEPEAFE